MNEFVYTFKGKLSDLSGITTAKLDCGRCQTACPNPYNTYILVPVSETGS